MNQPPKVPRPRPAPRVPTPPLVDAETGPGAVWPLVRPDGDRVLVTFLWRDADASAVLLFVNRLTDERSIGDSEMERLDGGDLWALTYRLERDWRGSYAFIPHAGEGTAPWRLEHGQPRLRALLDTGLADPGNPVSTTNRAGRRVSVAQLPGAPAQPWLAAPGAGHHAEAEIVDEATGRPRRVWSYATAGAGAGLPLVVVLDGDVWIGQHGLADSLDRAVTAGVLPPLCAVFVEAGDVATRWAEVGQPAGVNDFVVRDLVPWARENLGATHDPARTIAVGQSLGGLSALWLLARHPAVVGAAVAQSVSLWRDDVVSELAERTGIRIAMEVGRQEWALLGLHRDAAAVLGERCTLTEFNGGHDYACWRGGIVDRLADLLQDVRRS